MCTPPPLPPFSRRPFPSPPLQISTRRILLSIRNASHLLLFLLSLLLSPISQEGAHERRRRRQEVGQSGSAAGSFGRSMRQSNFVIAESARAHPGRRRANSPPCRHRHLVRPGSVSADSPDFEMAGFTPSAS